MRTLEIRIHTIAIDGLPDMDKLINRVAFLFDGNIVNGWPLLSEDSTGRTWEANDDVSHGGLFGGITHWVEFPIPFHQMKL